MESLHAYFEYVGQPGRCGVCKHSKASPCHTSPDEETRTQLGV